VRIIAGTLKGRRLDTPDWTGLRPTSDKMRETLFNVLGPSVTGARVLDAYAGTGAVGIEALSRGASHVTFADHDRRALDLVRRNLQRCGVADRYAIIRVDLARRDALAGSEPFDLMFFDPPYGDAELSAALAGAAALAGPGSRVVIEHARRNAPPAAAGSLVLTRDLVSGDSGLAFYQQP
jgi:16S rRNA (guanine966-N2)-methyltransferase